MALRKRKWLEMGEIERPTWAIGAVDGEGERYNEGDAGEYGGMHRNQY